MVQIAIEYRIRYNHYALNPELKVLILMIQVLSPLKVVGLFLFLFCFECNNLLLKC